MSRDSMARAYASITLPISTLALAELAFAAAALGWVAVGGLTRTAVVFAGIALTGGGAFDDAALVVTLPDAAPPLAGGFGTG